MNALVGQQTDASTMWRGGTWLHALGALLLDLLYPRRATCMGCGQMLGFEQDDLCEDCRRELAGSWIGPKQPDRRLKLAGAAHCHPYSGPASGMVRKLKYGSVWVLADMMGEEIARAVDALRISGEYIVTAVPMHPKRLRARGRNHAELLARSAAAKLGMEYRELLVRTRNAPQQARLAARERRQNLKGGFAVAAQPDALRGSTVLLIDDVCTTGSTARYCAAALRDAGVRRVYFASFALSRTGKRANGKARQ